MRTSLADNKRRQSIALVYAVTLAVLALSLVIGTRQLPIDWNAFHGWSSLITAFLLVGSATFMRRRPAIAALLAAAAGLVCVASNIDGRHVVTIAGTIVIGLQVTLAWMLARERRLAATRAAIHDRIDEELIDLSRAA